MMKSMRLFRSSSVATRLPINGEISYAVSSDPFFRRRRQVETENEKLRQQLDDAQRIIEKLQQATTPLDETESHASIQILVEGSEQNDDSTVFSNATTVKASGTPKRLRHERKQLSTPTKNQPPALLSTPSTPSTVVSDETSPTSRRVLQFWRGSSQKLVWKRTEPKLSDAALQLSDQEYSAPITASRRRRLTTQQELSLTMERYLHSDTTSSTRSLAEF
eukprot:CAMPEP_0119031200 /NCGR_PEP_ID=MMETSP1176-20130426/41422_1 /TAXON_ID=265551 /ORGANISM="Synedropsis recta cf, Strain CCMP1620" /LENGTH=219 /DNA_ID=CAMNT_0006987591 /DNA_START=46 /DNA_END=705 /DNA_ORIENTATION=+